MRLDKWLWVARFFKTRALASHACDLGRIESNSLKAKPSRDIKVGDTLHIKNEAGDFVVEVLGLSEMRGPAAVAQSLYLETPESLEARKLAAEQRKALFEMGAVPEGRPSKKDRRDIQRVRGK
jgi:ribosome-associated heat shock protein Hsp15